MIARLRQIPWVEVLLLAGALVLPFVYSDRALAGQVTDLFVFALLALGLNVVVGYTGLLHLGIAAFFGIGANITGILLVRSYPFQTGETFALTAAILGAAAAGVVLAAPTLRLRGDYLAIVTLGFGEVVRFMIQNLTEITNGTQTLVPVPSSLPKWALSLVETLGGDSAWASDYYLYFLTLGLLTLVVLGLRNVERARLGRAWVAVREDELAATCMGVNAARSKLGSALAGLAGGLFALNQKTTAGPQAYDFNRSIIILCCILLGGLGSIRGTLIGVVLLLGYDGILTPILDRYSQAFNPSGNRFLTFSKWRLTIFGLPLILMMRFRPEGLFPSQRVRQELHDDQEPSAISQGGA
jgi:branched-chain amino acid transport system permease protein